MAKVKVEDKKQVIEKLDWDEWSKYLKLIEKDILACLAEREREVWVKYAIVGYTIEEIQEIFKNKGIDHRCVDKILASAQIKLVAFLLKDNSNLLEIIQNNKYLKKKLLELLKKGGNYVSRDIANRVSFEDK